MASFPITIPDAQATRFKVAMCEYIGITVPAEQTNAKAKEGLNQLIKNTIKAQEQTAAMAAVPVVTDVDVT